MIVTLDTNVLIWGVKQAATDGQENKIREAQALLVKLAADQHTIALTTMAVAEYLAAFAMRDRLRQRKIIIERFPILPFDQNAMDVAADLLYDKTRLKDAQGAGGTRQCVKADLAIVATAIAHNVSTIYSEDTGMAAIAQGKIPVFDLSRVPDPTDVSHDS